MFNSNGDTNRIWKLTTASAEGATPEYVVGLGSFHKSLPHNGFGEVDPAAFAALVAATRGDGSGFAQVPTGSARPVVVPKDEGKFAFAAAFTNPQAGLAADRLTHLPSAYGMPPAPGVTSYTTAAEMLELYWMAILRDVDLSKFGNGCPEEGMKPDATKEAEEKKIASWLREAAHEITAHFECSLKSPASGTKPASGVVNNDGPEDHFILGSDIPGSAAAFSGFTPTTLFRLGFPGDDNGPMVSQFFLRPAPYGTQTIDQRQRPYKAHLDYLTDFNDWLAAQNSGCDSAGKSYSKSNESMLAPNTPGGRYEPEERYIATMRDLARFVNKDALHQAYFNAALILLSGQAKWPIGNPYHNLENDVVQGALADREAGFGVLGAPHLLALVSEVATRALKVVWRQKWQVHLRLRPEAYGGLVHVQNVGVGGATRDYKLPTWIAQTNAIKKHICPSTGSAKTMLLPMAFSAGSPTHPAYGAGHATVAGACVTVLKAFFLTYTTSADGTDTPIPFTSLSERNGPDAEPREITAYCSFVPEANTEKETCLDIGRFNNRRPLQPDISGQLTIEGELNKLAQNVAMGRSMGGVHWRTDNTRSLMLGEALAAEMLAGITEDVNETASFTFRTFARKADGKPKKVVIERGRVFVDGLEKTLPLSVL